jgi:hypothetical protein
MGRHAIPAEEWCAAAPRAIPEHRPDLLDGQSSRVREGVRALTGCRQATNGLRLLLAGERVEVQASQRRRVQSAAG